MNKINKSYCIIHINTGIVKIRIKVVYDKHEIHKSKMIKISNYMFENILSKSREWEYLSQFLFSWTILTKFICIELNCESLESIFFSFMNTVGLCCLKFWAGSCFSNNINVSCCLHLSVVIVLFIYWLTKLSKKQKIIDVCMLASVLRTILFSLKC